MERKKGLKEGLGMNASKVILVSTAIILLIALLILVLRTILLQTHTIELTLICELEYTEKTKIPGKTPIWWAQPKLTENHSYLGFELLEYTADLDSNEMLVISWGLPIKRLTYQKFSCFTNTVGYIAIPIFSDVPIKEQFFIYKTRKIPLLDEYLSHIEVVPEIKIE